VQLDWATPLLAYLGAARLHLQITFRLWRDPDRLQPQADHGRPGRVFGDW